METIYNEGKTFLLGTDSWLGSTWKCALVDGDYVFDRTHEYADLSLTAFTHQTLSGLTLTSDATGVKLGCAQIEFLALAAGTTVGGFVIYESGANTLLALVQVAAFVTDGGDLRLTGNPLILV